MFVRIRHNDGRELEFEHAELKIGLEQIEVHQDGTVVFSEVREAVTYWSVSDDAAGGAFEAGDGIESPHLRRVK